MDSYFSIQLVNKRFNELINSYNWLWRNVPDIINYSHTNYNGIKHIGSVNTSAYKFVKLKCVGKLSPQLILCLANMVPLYIGTEGTCYHVIKRGTADHFALRRARVDSASGIPYYMMRELSVLQVTYYDEYEYICMYVYIRNYRIQILSLCKEFPCAIRGCTFGSNMSSTHSAILYSIKYIKLLINLLGLRMRGMMAWT